MAAPTKFKFRVRKRAEYGGMPLQTVEWDGFGVIRFACNRIVRDYYDGTLTGKMNEIVLAYHNGRYSRAELVQFYQLIGYSVSGFGELSEVPKRVVAYADALAAGLVAEKEKK